MEYDLWYTSGNVKALSFIKNMKHWSKRMGKHALFTPHIFVNPCKHCTEVSQDCVRVGSQIYCSPPLQQQNVIGSLSLKMGVEEHCIYQTHKDENNAAKWWEYMNELYDCKDVAFAEQCRTKAQEKVNINRGKMRECETKIAEILESEYSTLLSNSIQYNPALVINKKIYRVQKNQ